MALRKSSQIKPRSATSIANLHAIEPRVPQVIPNDPRVRSTLMEVHQHIHRVTGAITLAYKNGPSADDLRDWAQQLRTCADRLDPEA